MRQVRPYRTVQGAKRALDNGGRFYNLRSMAGDEVVEAGELARAAGVHSADIRAFLHFEMALMELAAGQRAEVLAMLSPRLHKRLAAKQSRVLLPSRVEVDGAAGVPAIVTGYPFFVEDKTQIRGFVVMTTPVIAMIPIADVFDVYEVFDSPARLVPRTLLATVRGSKRLDGSRFRFGGLLRERVFDDSTGKDHGLYLEAMAYTPLE